ncbi:MAG: PAS domain-containing sensor histidine kinase [Candidatus Obscuribacterales bacterium]|nr:PAS domain-containing sensor histidine kinase [Candidatus Obscuribacterales bacterium]
MAPTSEARLSSKLRNWYLAGLRKKAFAATHELTPMTLIEADRQFIESLIAESADSHTAGTALPSGPVQKSKDFVFVIAWLAIMLGTAGVSLCISPDPPLTLQLIFHATLGLLMFNGPTAANGANLGVTGVSVIAFFVVPLCTVLVRVLQSRTMPTGVVVGFIILMVSPVILAILAVIALRTESGASADAVYRTAGAILAWQCVISTIFGAALYRGACQPLTRAYRQLGPGQRGNLQGLTATISDLQRERLEYESRERAIVDAAEELICCVNAELRIFSVSKSCEKTLGYLSAELVGRQLNEMCFPDDVDRLTHFFKRVRTEEGSHAFETRMISKSGKPVDLLWSADWSESEDCYFICARNVTDQRNLERAKREFVAMIGHDIRVPVGSVLLGVESVAQGYFGEIPQTAAKTLDRLQNSLRRLIELINELLDFEKASAGKMSVTMKRMDLSEVLNTVILDAADLSTKKNIQIKYEAAPIEIKGDAAKLNRVFLNLLSNAIKFSNNDSLVELTVNVESDFVEVRVRDHGRGISPEYQLLVFERYERIDAEKSAIEGTGLGLAIAKAIVEAHAGMIGVESAIGEGSTFWVTLPYERA